MSGNGYMFIRQGETSDYSDAQNVRDVVWWLWVTWPKPATVTGVVVHGVLPAERESGKSWAKCWSQEQSWPQAELQRHQGVRRKVLTMSNRRLYSCSLHHSVYRFEIF